MTCPLCATDSHVPGLKWTDGVVSETKGTRRKCGFLESGDRGFTEDNWNCVTLGRLRDACVWSYRCDDQNGSVGAVPIPYGAETCQGYLVMTWYKSRGACGRAYIVYDDEDVKPLTLAQAIEILALLNPVAP